MMINNLSKMIAENMIVRASFYYPAYSSSVFVLNQKPFFLNIVKNETARKPILNLYTSSEPNLYLYAPNNGLRTSLNKETLIGAIDGKENCKKEIEDLIQSLLK